MEVPQVQTVEVIVERVVEVPIEKVINVEVDKSVEGPVEVEKMVELNIASKCIASTDAATATEPSQLYSVVNAEMTDAREILAKLNHNKGDMIEVVKRTFGLLGIDPGVRDIEFMLEGMRTKLIVKCSDSRLALGEKCSTIKQATSIIEETIGVRPLAVFVERC